jgi:enoyl-CoA hydratase/carnithine racemase
MATPDLRQLGVVSHAAAPGQALQTALNLAKDLCARAPNVLASIKELVNNAADQTLSMHLAAEQKHFVKNLHHLNGGEGIRSFMEKRTADYK